MTPPTKSCPKCGALIVPQLARCRQCKTYLHGTVLEGLFVENLLPAQMQRAPATATIMLFIVLYYGLMIALAGKESLFSFSRFSLLQLGATEGTSIMLGDFWRFVTSIFVHHHPIHLVLNLSSLVFVGELVERILDRKKMFLIYLVSGVTSMMISHLWYTSLGSYGYVSGGASGAVSGMIGAAWFAARKIGPSEAEVVRAMKRWAGIMVVWGFLAPGINNAAHFGGFAVGALLAHFTPVGHAQTVTTQRILSLIAIGAIGAVLASCALMIQNLRGYPAALEDDYFRGKEFAYSSQKILIESCVAEVEEGKRSDETVKKCELARRSFTDHKLPYLALIILHEARGEKTRADQLKALVMRVPMETALR